MKTTSPSLSCFHLFSCFNRSNTQYMYDYKMTITTDLHLHNSSHNYLRLVVMKCKSAYWSRPHSVKFKLNTQRSVVFIAECRTSFICQKPCIAQSDWTFVTTAFTIFIHHWFTVVLMVQKKKIQYFNKRSGDMGRSQCKFRKRKKDV